MSVTLVNPDVMWNDFAVKSMGSNLIIPYDTQTYTCTAQPPGVSGTIQYTRYWIYESITGLYDQSNPILPPDPTSDGNAINFEAMLAFHLNSAVIVGGIWAPNYYCRTFSPGCWGTDQESYEPLSDGTMVKIGDQGFNLGDSSNIVTPLGNTIISYTGYPCALAYPALSGDGEYIGSSSFLASGLVWGSPENSASPPFYGWNSGLLEWIMQFS